MIRKAVPFIAVALLLGACAPKLVIRHEDPTYPVAEIVVDGEPVGAVDLGDKLSMRVQRGYHRVEATPPGEIQSPWAPDGEGWTFYVDRRAELQLMPQSR